MCVYIYIYIYIHIHICHATLRYLRLVSNTSGKQDLKIGALSDSLECYTRTQYSTYQRSINIPSTVYRIRTVCRTLLSARCSYHALRPVCHVPCDNSKDTAGCTICRMRRYPSSHSVHGKRATCGYTYIYIYIYIHIITYVYICVYIYIYILMCSVPQALD